MYVEYVLMMQVPRAVQMYSLDISIKTGRSKLRDEFQRNSHIRDPRVIDMLVIKVCTGPSRVHSPL